MGVAERRRIFGDPRLVVIGPEDELHDRRHRRAILHREPGFFRQFGEVFGALQCGEGEIVGPADGVVECVARAFFGMLRRMREFAGGG